MRGQAWLVAGLAALAVPALIDIATGDDAFARSLYLLPVLLIATRARAYQVAVIGVLATALAVLSTLWNDTGGSGLPLVTVVVGSAIAVLGARERHAAIAARAAAETERRQLRLLGDAARITDGAADIDEALRRLVRLLVPDFADAAWVDVLRAGGGVRRLAARADGPDREELEALAARARRGGARRAVADHARAARRGQPAGGARRAARRGDRARRRRSPAAEALAAALDDGAAARAERRAAGRSRRGGRALGTALWRRRPGVRGAADRTRRARARQHAARQPPDRHPAAAGRHLQRAGGGGDRPGRQRPDRVRQPGGGRIARAARGPRRARGRAERAGRPLRDPPSRRPPGATRTSCRARACCAASIPSRC